MQNFTSEMFSLLGYTKEVLDNVKMPLPPVDDRNSSGIVGELNDFEKDCLKILAKIEKEHIVFHEKNSILGTDETVSEHDAILLKSDFFKHLLSVSLEKRLNLENGYGFIVLEGFKICKLKKPEFEDLFPFNFSVSFHS